MTFNQEEFNDFILDNNILKLRENSFTLKSGRESTLYVNWRDISQSARLVDHVTDYILDFSEENDIEPRSFIGVPEGASYIGLITQFKWYKKNSHMSWDYPLPMGRGKPKEHGDPKNRYFIGFPAEETTVLEDVTTTGGSMIDFIEHLQESGVEVSTAIGLTNRNEIREDGRSVEEAVEDLGVEYHALSHAADLIPRFIEKEFKKLKRMKTSVQDYFEEYGTKELNF